MQKIIKVLIQFSTLTAENMLYFSLEILMENLSSPNLVPEPVSSSVSAPVTTQQNNRNWLIPLFSVLILLLLASTGYLYYQNQQLKSMLASYKPRSTSTPPTTSDSTANWKTYTSSIQNFSFKVPQEFAVSETKNGIEVFLTQEALDKSKTCKPDPKEVEPLPCSPFLFDIFYAEVPKVNYPSGEDYVNQVRGGMGGNPPYQTIQGQGLVWTVGQAAGLELKPTVRAFAYDGSKIRYLQLSTYILPYWGYTRNSSSNNADWSIALAQTDWTKLQNFSYLIISTFKFLDSSSNNIYTGKNFSIDTSIWKLLSDANQSPATPEVLETVAFENGQARMNIQVGTDAFEKVLASQDGEVVGNVVIDGATATKKSGYGGIAGSVYSVNLVLARQGKTYIIGFYTEDTGNISDYEKKFNEAVSTFKFTQ